MTAENGRRAAGLMRTVRAGLAHHQAGRLDHAEALYRKALQKDPDHADALHLLGVVAYQCGKIAPALRLIGRALPRLAQLPDAHLNYGNALHQAGRLPEAVESYRRAIALDPDCGMAHSNLARALDEQGSFAAALDAAARAVQLLPDFPGAHINFATALNSLGRLPEAVGSYRQAIALNPDVVEAHHNLGLALEALGRLDQAEASYRRTLALSPELAEAHYNLGNTLQGQGRLDEAAEQYRKALVPRPEFVEAHNNLGNALQTQRQFEEAVASYRQALVLRPDFSEAHNNLGNALQAQRQFEEAVASYRQALVLRPDFPEAYKNLGNALALQGELPEAIDCYRQAATLRPSDAGSLAAWFHQRQHICDWAGYREDEARVRGAIKARPSIGTALMLEALSSTPGEQFECARQVAAQLEVPKSLMLANPWPKKGGRIRLGYFSADFRRHAVALLIAGLFEHHERREFEVIGYSAGPNDGSEIRSRLAASFDRFVDISELSDRAAAQLIHTDEIDILVDLTGLTRYTRTGVLAYRPAPIQVNYLGYPGTTGAKFIDYIVVDPFVAPPHQQAFYSERLVHLPHCYQCNDNQRVIAAQVPSRAECGLPEPGFVFCCFNNSYKINPTFFDIWMRLLSAVPKSVLWLLDTNRWAKANLRREAAARGIAAERLFFAPRLASPLHLARHRLADLFLDTLPYNAATTASDALWAELLVLTCAGDTFASRVAGSLLRSIGLPELVTNSLEEYEALALRLAHEPMALAQLRARLAQNRLTHPLFDTALFTRNIEKAYRRMWEIWAAGRPPAPFSVNPTRSSLKIPPG